MQRLESHGSQHRVVQGAAITGQGVPPSRETRGQGLTDRVASVARTPEAAASDRWAGATSRTSSPI
ncbi:hypothetical protein DRB96_19365 [Streptomyces sp. ICC1]|nr:hypothetical protein DRB89_32675 [Streptomyces sp. ICC4]AWZ14078.1 hypothetical protein DRB96_19365 [Streptomyces sp. ICC1]